MFDVAIDWISVALSVAAVRVLGIIALPLAVFIIGNRLRALGNMLHEAAYRNLHRSARINDTLARLLIAPAVFASLTRYRAGHQQHHLNLGHSTADPDYIDSLSSTRCVPWQSFGQMLLRSGPWWQSIGGQLVRTRCEYELAAPYQSKAWIQTAMERAAERTDQINALMDRIDTTADQKSILELQGCLQAENALLQHESTQIALARDLAESELRVAESRAREAQLAQQSRVGDSLRNRP